MISPCGGGLQGRFPFPRPAGCPIKFDGNQALAFGALLGGCRFMAGHPMTPGTSILHYFAEAAQDLPVHFEQAEDEIVAINTVLGTSQLLAEKDAAFSPHREFPRKKVCCNADSQWMSERADDDPAGNLGFGPRFPAGWAFCRAKLRVSCLPATWVRTT
jgi:hypothetical protein